MTSHAVDGQRRGADALDPDAEPLEEEAEVLDHVVGAGVADDRHAVVARGGQQDVLGDGVTALGKDDRPRRPPAGVGCRLVEAVRGDDVEAEVPQRRQVRLDGAGTEVAATGIRQPEPGLVVQQRPEEHDHRPGAAGGLDVDAVEVQHRRGDDLQVVAAREPAGPHAEGVQHLEDPVDLLDAGEVAQRGAAPVQQRGAQQRDRGVLGGLDVDGAVQLLAADDAQVLGAGVAEGDELGVQALADAGQRLQAEVLLALLDPGDRALAGAQRPGQLGLGESLVPARVPDQRADPPR